MSLENKKEGKKGNPLAYDKRRHKKGQAFEEVKDFHLPREALWLALGGIRKLPDRKKSQYSHLFRRLRGFRGDCHPILEKNVLAARGRGGGGQY